MTAARRSAAVRRGAGIAVCIALLGLLRPAAAQQIESGQTFERLLIERDAIIIQLLRRVAALEQRLAELDGVAPPAPAAGPQLPPATPGAGEPGPAPSQEIVPAQPAAPGQFEVDEAAAERALERVLVQGGALLLNAGEAEITPSFRYLRRVSDAPVALAADAGIVVAGDELRRDVFEWELGLRLGLPFDLQVELALPYRLVDQSEVLSVGFTPQQERSSSGAGLGDLSIGLAKTLLRERRWWPDLVGRVTWDTATGQLRDGGVLLGGGFHEITGSLTATKRQDPLVFLGGTSYSKRFENDDIKPGDQLGFTLGAILAASPETSLRFTFEQTFTDEAEIDGNQIDGSDLTAGTLNLGASVILGPRLLLDVVTGIGVTDDAPDYSIRASLPLRFNTPLR